MTGARFRVGLMVGFIAATATVLVNIGLRLLGVLSDSLDFGRLADWALGSTADPWLVFTLGVVVAVAFGSLVGGLYLVVVRSPSVVKGIAFVVPVWLTLNLVLVPLNGSATFSQVHGSELMLGTLVLGVVFGTSIGLLGERFHVVAGAPGM